MEQCYTVRDRTRFSSCATNVIWILCVSLIWLKPDYCSWILITAVVVVVVVGGGDINRQLSSPNLPFLRIVKKQRFPHYVKDVSDVHWSQRANRLAPAHSGPPCFVGEGLRWREILVIDLLNSSTAGWSSLTAINWSMRPLTLLKLNYYLFSTPTWTSLKLAHEVLFSQ